ncbi:hypothetical protein CR513_46044, partial [Mucuna pruriens]
MEEENEVLIILGRPFLPIGRAVIDFEQENLILDFNVFNPYKISSSLVSCNYVQALDIFDREISGKYFDTRKPFLKILGNSKPCKEPA